ncbi:pyridoxamine 5'-phosphate oxidase [Zestomonas carbonaria]|uniref:Pyridoxine/pyridoxamine 5'-phosphate oxidase n=1 Tax=Zestomonas carbonaria TaxID=2762745 RepID=A0A7U7EPW0_9GAMM|nr:pyridoxamine 5'-phosphate oxidase [Pseudomonas carbonaria]CAD5108994.1 Pyridoxine/pyridoxamine 5'-phosphate oxidase [Pseudomonas carbonaria]
MREQLKSVRRRHLRGHLHEAQAPQEPFALLRLWLRQAIDHEAPSAEGLAMFLATADDFGRPHGRMVHLRDVDERGLVFHSHYRSAKGQDLAINPHAALTFHWPGLERQLRIEGRVEPVSATESDASFHNRPLDRRLACWACEQSQPVNGRGELEARLAQARYRFLDSTPPRPSDWGGYRLLPERMEFWQGRPGGLHDRLDYQKDDTGWHRERLAP